MDQQRHVGPPQTFHMDALLQEMRAIEESKLGHPPIQGWYGQDDAQDFLFFFHLIYFQFFHFILYY